MNSSSRSELYDLLNLAEDYLRDGFHHDHPPLSDPAHGEVQRQDGFSAQQEMEHIADQVRACTRCALHKQRRKAVPGAGAISPLVMIIGEGPGYDEDRTGVPFVGRAGKYLDRWLAAIDLDRNRDCFIGNIVKCRPPGNRDPLPEESSACLPYLERQIVLLNPKAILTLGRISTQILSERTEGIGRLRGLSIEYRGIPLIATYHPSAVLRNNTLREPVWEDLKRLKALLEDLASSEPAAAT